MPAPEDDPLVPTARDGAAAAESSDSSGAPPAEAIQPTTTIDARAASIFADSPAPATAEAPAPAADSPTLESTSAATAIPAADDFASIPAPPPSPSADEPLASEARTGVAPAAASAAPPARANEFDAGGQEPDPALARVAELLERSVALQEETLEWLRSQRVTFVG